jgi:hypothetical protein
MKKCGLTSNPFESSTIAVMRQRLEPERVWTAALMLVDARRTQKRVLLANLKLRLGKCRWRI